MGLKITQKGKLRSPEILQTPGKARMLETNMQLRRLRHLRNPWPRKLVSIKLMAEKALSKAWWLGCPFCMPVTRLGFFIIWLANWGPGRTEWKSLMRHFFSLLNISSFSFSLLSLNFYNDNSGVQYQFLMRLFFLSISRE